MVKVERCKENPILKPNKENWWEAEAVFNGCVVKDYANVFHLLYRAISLDQPHGNLKLKVSSIGHATSDDGIHFRNRHLLIEPEYRWEFFGCEDPRVTKLDGKYFIFYTAVSTYPPTPPAGVRIGVATLTKDFREVTAKHPVTPFNSKAMALFPERIGGKIAGVLTVNPDLPPAKIGIAFFDDERQIWSTAYWRDWLSALDNHVLLSPKTGKDHIEVGAPPLKTDRGWLLIYSEILNAFSPLRVFGIGAALLDIDVPTKVVARTEKPILVPQAEYELYGNVPKVVFPVGALIEDGKLFIYYGAADTTCCLATCELKNLMEELLVKHH